MHVKRIQLPYCRQRFLVKGLNLERFLNTVQKENIPLHSAARTSKDGMTCVCNACDFMSIQKIADEKGWRVESVQPVGLASIAFWVQRRPGILAGFIVSMILVLFLSGFVWRVDVQNAGAYLADIRAYLNENGFHRGVPRNAVDADLLERLLTERYPEIAWFHVHVSGMTLVVEVTQGNISPESLSKQPCDIVAAKSGIVHSIRVYAGTAAVKEGDAVHAGQVLIRGEERAADGETVAVHARGAVTARCWQTVLVKVPLYEISSTETGKETETLRIQTPIGSLSGEWPSPPYLAYNTYVEMLPVGGAFFPIAALRVIQREVSMEYVPRTLEDVRKEAETAAFRQLKTMLGSNEIIDKWTDYCMIEDDTLVVSVTAEQLVDIGGESPP